MQPFSIHEVGARAMLPPPDILVSEWADENRVLTGGAAAERGQWRTRHYQREPMDVLSPGHPCRQVVLLSAAQMMKTEVLLNFLGFISGFKRCENSSKAGNCKIPGRNRGWQQHPTQKLTTRSPSTRIQSCADWICSRNWSAPCVMAICWRAVCFALSCSASKGLRNPP